MLAAARRRRGDRSASPARSRRDARARCRRIRPSPSPPAEPPGACRALVQARRMSSPDRVGSVAQARTPRRTPPCIGQETGPRAPLLSDLFIWRDDGTCASPPPRREQKPCQLRFASLLSARWVYPTSVPPPLVLRQAQDERLLNSRSW